MQPQKGPTKTTAPLCKELYQITWNPHRSAKYKDFYASSGKVGFGISVVGSLFQASRVWVGALGSRIRGNLGFGFREFGR